MEKSKNLVLSICLFVTGVIGSGLFAIGQSLVILARSIKMATYNEQNVCGVLCFIFLILAIVGCVMMIVEMVNKKENKSNI